jgi:hypothetical protein
VLDVEPEAPAPEKRQRQRRGQRGRIARFASVSATVLQTPGPDEDRALHPTLSSLLLCERRDVEAIAAAAAATQRSIETVC